MHKTSVAIIKMVYALSVSLTTSPVFAANLIENSSFEVGTAGWGQSEHNAGYALTDSDIVTSESKYGQRSLQIYSRGGKTERVIRVTSAGYRLRPGETYTLSAWVRKNSPKIKTGQFVMRLSNLVHTEYQGSISKKNQKVQFVQRRIRLGSELEVDSWTRFELTLPEVIPTSNPKSGRVYDIYQVGFFTLNCSGFGEIWIDGVQLENSASATPYSPADSTEVGAIFPSIDSAFTHDPKNPPTCLLRLFNHNSRHSNHTLSWEVRNLFDEIILKSTAPVATTDGNVELLVSLPNLLGAFRLIVSEQGNEMIHEKVYSVLPVPRKFSNPRLSYAGAYMNIHSQEPINLMAKAGFHQAAMLRHGGWFRWKSIRGKRNLFRQGTRKNPFQGRNKIRKCFQNAATRGIRTLGILQGIGKSYIPKGVDIINGFPIIDRVGDSWDSNDPQGPYDPTKDDFQEYVTDVVNAYKNDIDTWIIQDEADSFKVDMYAKLHHAACEVITSIYDAMDPPKPVDIILSARSRTYVDGVEQAIDSLGGTGRDEISGIQRTNQGGKKIIGINDWINLKPDGKYWIDGVTSFTTSLYTQYPQHNRKDSYYANFVRVRSDTQRTFNSLISKMRYNFKHWLHYEATYLSPRITDYDSKSIFEYDGGLAPQGVAYASIWKRLDGAIHLDIGASNSKWSQDRRIEALLFDQSQDPLEKKYVMAVIVRNRKSSSHGSISHHMSLTFLDEDVSDLTFLDAFGNPSTVETVTIAGQTNPKTTIHFNDLGFFIEGDRTKSVLNRLKRLATYIEAKGRVLFNVLPWGISAVERTPFAVVIDNSKTHQYRIFAHRHDILTGEKAHLGWIKTFEETVADSAQTWTLENIEDGHTIYTILSKDIVKKVDERNIVLGTMKYERWIALTGEMCSVKLKFSNSAQNIGGGLHYALGIRHDIGSSNTTGNTTDPSFVHLLENRYPLQFNFDAVQSDPIQKDAEKWKKGNDNNLGYCLSSPRNFSISQHGWIERSFNIRDYGLIGHWRLDETSNTNAKDSARENPGINMGAIPGHSAIERTGYYFDNDAKVEISNSKGDNSIFNFGDSHSFTVSVWASDENNLGTNSWGPVIAKGSRGMAYSSQHVGWGISRAGAVQNKYRFTLNDRSFEGEGYVTLNTPALSPGFHHLVMVVDREQKRMAAFVDGKYAGHKDITKVGDIDDPDKPVNVAFSDKANDSFIGYLDDVRIYNYALTTDQISNLYTVGQVDLLGHWTLDDLELTTVVDVAKNQNGINSGASIFNKGVFGFAYYFDNDAKVEILNSGGDHSNFDFGDSRSFTISAWASDENNSVTKVWAPIVAKGSKAMAHSRQGQGWGMSRATVQNKYGFTINDTTAESDGFVTINTPALSPGFHHLAMVVDRENKRLVGYADGEFIGGVDIAKVGDIDDPDKPVNFAFSDKADEAFLGYIDDVRIYNRPLSSTEVFNLYNTRKDK